MNWVIISSCVFSKVSSFIFASLFSLLLALIALYKHLCSCSSLSPDDISWYTGVNGDACGLETVCVGFAGVDSGICCVAGYGVVALIALTRLMPNDAAWFCTFICCSWCFTLLLLSVYKLFDPRSLDSESSVLTVTPRGQLYCHNATLEKLAVAPVEPILFLGFACLGES